MSEEAFNIVTLLVDRHVEAGRGGKAALLEGSRTRTFAQLQRATRVLAGRLSERDGRPGQRVAVASEDSLLMMMALLGIMRAGKVAVLLPTLPGGFEPYLRGAAPELLVTTSAMRDRLPGFPEERVLVLDSDEALLSGPDPAPLPPVPATRGSDAFCLFTSGTTGSPSAVAHRHQDMEVTNEDYGAEVLGLTEDDVTYSPSPLFFAYGLNSAHFALYHGATAVLPGTDRRPQVVLDTLQRHRATVFFTVPTLYRLILDKTQGGDLSGVRLCVSAGEALPARVFEEWRERFGKPILDGIGTTEMLSTFISQRPGEERAGCTGRPVRGFEVRLLDGDGREVAPGQQGVLWVRGRTHPDRYLHSEEATRRRFRDGGFITNDVFFQDADGFFHHCGRSDDMVKVGGQWVSPCGVESVLLEHLAISECAVVNRVDAWGLLRPSAYVVLRDGHTR